MEAYDAELCVAEARGQLDDLIERVEALAQKSKQAHEVERVILTKVLSLGKELMRLYFAEMGTGNVGDAVVLKGQALPLQKQLLARDYFSIFGKLAVPRSRYRARSGESVFPLDRQANLPERCYSYLVQEMAGRLDADLPFREGAKYLEDLFGLEISESVLIDLAKDAAVEYDAFYKARKAPAPESEGGIQVVSFDGKGIPMIRKEAVKLKARLGKGEKRQKKKEALVGVGYTVEPNQRTAKDLAHSLVDPEAARVQREKLGSREDPPRAKNIRRIARLAVPKKDVVLDIHDDAKRRDPKYQRPLAVLVDGAFCLEDLVRAQFTEWPVVHFVLDIIHVLEYLWGVANALSGEQTDESRSWVQEKLTDILEGRVGYVIGGLRQTLSKRQLKKAQQEAINKAITYFDNHRHLMRYDEYLAAGLPVATSVVESSCGTLVKHRMEGAGKRWGIEGADAVLKLRSLKMSNANDLADFARYRARRERHRLYGARPQYELAKAA